MREKIKKIFKNFAALFFGLSIAFIICEIVLRIYNPFEFRVKGDKIILPCNKKYIIRNTKSEKLDTLIVHTKNSLGFRGNEKPADYDKLTTIIAIGGSTTECYYLGDGQDWPSLVGKKLQEKYNNTWVNNAGLDGQSTFGHTILLTDYVAKLKPKYILYLVGSNDVGRKDLNEFDKNKMKDKYQSFGNFFTKNSEVAALFVNIVRGLRAQKENLWHAFVDFKAMKHTVIDTTVLSKFLEDQKPFVIEYKKRLTNLIQKTKAYNIQPILITQPTIVGKAIDEPTGTNLATIQLMNPNGGYTYQQILEKYNDATREVAKEQHITLVELANKMPKNSLYYFDGLHYTNEGSKKVSEIVFETLDSTLAKSEFNLKTN